MALLGRTTLTLNGIERDRLPALARRCGIHLVLCHILREVPGEGIMIVSDTKKATKAQNRVRDLPGPLVDHDALDRTDLRVIPLVNRSALNFVAADQANCFSFFIGLHILRLKSGR